MSKPKGLLERLAGGEMVLVAEGYTFELEARGYLKAGAFVPEVVLEHPEVVRDLHREFVHAGSDVVLASTYYGHREKLRVIGREDDLEKLNRTALKIAREVADETGTLMAGNLSNSTIYNPDDPKIQKEIYDMYAEQVKWAVEGGADYLVGETFYNYDEAMLALRAMKEHGNGLPTVITCSPLTPGKIVGAETIGEACIGLEEAGADVVGLNCSAGPATMLPLLKEVKEACKGPMAALPLVFRTNDKEPSWLSLTMIDDPEVSAFPVELYPHACSRKQISEFAQKAKALGFTYLGLCCGNRGFYMRAMAEAVGRMPPASRFSPDMSLHYSNIKDGRHQHNKGVFNQCHKPIAGN